MRGPSKAQSHFFSLKNKNRYSKQCTVLSVPLIPLNIKKIVRSSPRPSLQFEYYVAVLNRLSITRFYSRIKKRRLRHSLDDVR